MFTMKNRSAELNDLFVRGVTDFIDPEGKFKEKIQKKLDGKYSHDIVIKFGVDPTRPDIHLGHAVILRKLRKFQDLGCKVVFLVGDFTAHIGDPTGKSSIRPELEQKEIEANMKTYLEQVGKILRTEPEIFSWIRNSDWFYNLNDLVFSTDTKVNIEIADQGGKKTASLDQKSFLGKAVLYLESRMQKTHLHKSSFEVITLRGFLWTLRHITHSRLIERDMFQERIKRGEELYMHEMMYPVLQGIDSYILAKIYGSCDLEIGGNDQTFNMLIGRDVMKFNNISQQAVMALRIIEGLDGKEKMSKNLGNYIAITESPNEMFGKIMSIPDTSTINYFELATYEPIDEIEKIKKAMAQGKNPRDFKIRLAKEIVAIYHGEQKAKEAEKNFIKVFQKKEIPEEMMEIRANKGDQLSDLLIKHGVLKSKSEFTRLVDEKAIHNMETKEAIGDYHFQFESDLALKIGKKRFLKISSLRQNK